MIHNHRITYLLLVISAVYWIREEHFVSASGNNVPKQASSAKWANLHMFTHNDPVNFDDGMIVLPAG